MHTFSYRKFGEGPETWLCFHGFGQDSVLFKNLAAPSRTVYSFDLFFHRERHNIPKGQAVRPEAWERFLHAFLRERGIGSFSLMAFSMGGRLALMTAQRMPQYVEKLVLLAPDGIYTHWWFSAATQTPLGRKTFKGVLKGYPILNIAMLAGTKIGLVDQASLKLVNGQVNRRSERSRLFNGWLAHREFRFELPALAAVLNQHDIPLHLVVGKHDSIFPAKVYQKFLGMLHQRQLIEMPCGHYWLVQYFLRNYLSNHPMPSLEAK